MTAKRGKFSADLVGLAKTDNAHGATRAKIQIRELLLGAVPDARVFDGFAGEGHMHDAVWHRAAGYVGCDTRFFRDQRLAFVADNRRVLRAIDLSPFNVFDFDAYGSPWEQVLILAARRLVRPAERLGLCLTEGQALKLKMGGMSRALSQLSGVGNQPGLGRQQDEIINRALLRTAELMHARIADRWQAVGKTGSRMVYLGIVLEGLSP